MKRGLSGVLLVCVLLIGGMTISAQSLLGSYSPVTAEMPLNPLAGEWLMWRHNYASWAHSPLDKSNKDNGEDLGLAWAWNLDPARNELPPLVHDGGMFH